MIISQLDQTCTSFPHFSLSMLDTRKFCSQCLIFGLNRIASCGPTLTQTYTTLTTVMVSGSIPPSIPPRKHNVIDYSQEWQLQVMPSLHAVPFNTCGSTISNFGQYYRNLCRPIRVDHSWTLLLVVRITICNHSNSCIFFLLYVSYFYSCIIS